MQIRTGEGKSIALGGGAALLALLGFRVRCICYSKYLSQRDENAFSNLFAELQLQNNGSERIVYSTITEYSPSPADLSIVDGHGGLIGPFALSDESSASPWHQDLTCYS